MWKQPPGKAKADAPWRRSFWGKARDDLIIRVRYQPECAKPFSHIITFNYHCHPLIRFCLVLQMKEPRLREMAGSVQVHPDIQQRFRYTSRWCQLCPLPNASELFHSKLQHRNRDKLTYFPATIKIKLVVSQPPVHLLSACQLPGPRFLPTAELTLNPRLHITLIFLLQTQSLFLPNGIKGIPYLYPRPS